MQMIAKTAVLACVWVGVLMPWSACLCRCVGGHDRCGGGAGHPGICHRTPLSPHVAGAAVPGNGRTPLPDCGGRNVEAVDNRTEARDFLATRRARITPEQA